MIYSLYRGLTSIAGPMISHYLKKRLKRGKEHPTRFNERLGQANMTRPDGPLIWLHGASVGEAISLLPLIDAIRQQYSASTLLMTTGTVTSAKLMEDRLPKEVIHQFIPVDRLPYVRRFLDHWQPDLAIWAESELWPNLVCETKKRNVAMVLINARMSDKSLKTWQKLKGFAETLLKCFDLCLAQTPEDARRYAELGANNVLCTGNLKYASPDLPVNADVLQEISSLIQERPRWLGASTHLGEEAMIGRIHQQLKAKHPNLLSIIAPRHPERGSEICEELRQGGLSVAQRSKGEQISAACDVYVADTLGEMGLFYRLAPVVYMGKSMEPLGGQNPLEPARLDCALVCGPYMTNFAEMMARFTEGNAICVVNDENALTECVDSFITSPSTQQAAAANAKRVAYAQAEVLAHTMDALAPYLVQANKGKTV